MGGNDVNKLANANSFRITIDGAAPTTSITDLTSQVGSSVKLTGLTPVTTGSGNHIVVTGLFADNANQVLLDTYV
jgi:hypothetical protein